MQPQFINLASRCRRNIAVLLAICTGIFGVAQVSAQDLAESCGPRTNHYGPFDYRTQKDKLTIVEPFHFTPEVEALIRGKSGYLEADIAYTLHVSPNHHRALIAMSRLGEKMKTPKLPHAAYSVECYFLRAVRFAPNDTIVRILYAQLLGKNDRVNDAVLHLDSAVVYATDNGFSHYNIGLAYYDLKQYDKALVQAHRASELGFNRTELADLLKSANKWQEPSK